MNFNINYSYICDDIDLINKCHSNDLIFEIKDIIEDNKLDIHYDYKSILFGSNYDYKYLKKIFEKYDFIDLLDKIELIFKQLIYIYKDGNYSDLLYLSNLLGTINSYNDLQYSKGNYISLYRNINDDKIIFVITDNKLKEQINKLRCEYNRIKNMQESNKNIYNLLFDNILLENKDETYFKKYLKYKKKYIASLYNL
jgi:hypothetical protein